MTDTAARTAAELAAGTARARELAAELTRDLSTARGGAVPITLPWTGETLHALPHATVADVDAAEAAARAAQPAWAAVPPAERRRILLRAHDLLLQRRRDVVDLLQLETGKGGRRPQAIRGRLDAAPRRDDRHARPARRRADRTGLATVRVDQVPKGSSASSRRGTSLSLRRWASSRARSRTPSCRRSAPDRAHALALRRISSA